MSLENEELLVEVDELKKLMDLLSNLFSIRTSFLYAIGDDQYDNEIAGNNGDYQQFCRIIQEEMHEKCIACDREKFKIAVEKRKPLLYKCFNGLYEMFLPLFIEESLVGYLHFGQIRSEDDFETIARECGLWKHSKIEKLRKSYETMEIIPKEKLIQISELFQKMSDNILKNKLVELRWAKPEYYLKKYVEENYSKDINLSTAAKYINRSSSFVTHKFKEVYGCTFHQFLTRVRINASKELLKKDSIIETFQKCGFKNRYHFSKVFKLQEAITPFEFQNSN
ncbi:MAG: PocR ligand-binding domain-containing protein [Bacteroidetes bacterium]|nr:PocR ligand-binding domain-containing protein [Bacteroidota bacterium]